MKKKEIIRFLKISFLFGTSMLGMNVILDLIGILGYTSLNWKGVIINVVALGPTVAFVLKKFSDKKNGKGFFIKF